MACYMRIVKLAVKHPDHRLLLAAGLLVAVSSWPIRQNGAGVEFFPNVEPDYGLLYVHARGNLSLDEMDLATKRGGTPHSRLAGREVGLHARRQGAGRRQQRHRRRTWSA